jgi:hypothetical protein
MEKLEVRHDMLIVDRHAVELFQEVEGDVRLPILDGEVDRTKITLDS